MKKALIYFLLLISGSLSAQLPNTDIWLLDIKSTKDTIILSNPVNITNRPGYDNQPAFSPDGKYILYTSIRDEKQSDIYKYDLKTKQISIFESTPKTSEYSPTFMPDGKNISVVMVEPDSAQRLWKFPLKGGEPSLIMDKVDSIGYHCWINKDSLALVMITEPPSINLVNIKSEKKQHFKKNVGRCLQSFPDSSFTYLQANDPHDTLEWPLYLSTIYYTQICPAGEPMYIPRTVQDYYISSFKNFSGPVIFFGYRNLIVGLSYRTNGTACRADLTNLKIKVSRIAISPDGTKMAIVAE